MTFFQLFKKFGDHSGYLMAGVVELQKIRGEENIRDLLTPIQRLNIDLTAKIAELNNIKEDLHKVIIFLKRFPLKKYYEENDIFELDYIKYHLEVFFHKVATGSDLLKLLVNVVFDLGIDNKRCKLKILKEKIPNEYEQQFIKLIEAYDDTFKSIKSFRHKNSHEAKFYDEKYDRLKLFDTLYRNSIKFGLNIDDIRILMPEGYLEFSIKELRKDRIKWVEEAMEMYELYIDKIIENSIYVYFEKYKLFKASEL